MKIQPRIYQQEAHDAAIDAWKQHTKPILIEAATGAGKSVIIAMLAKSLFDLSGGRRVLCLAPSAELVTQNAEKYALLGEDCSIYSASAGQKSLRHQVVFATEGTFKAVAKRLGHQFAGVIVDECHRLTPTIKAIIDDMRETSPNLRVCGLSATPFRLGEGYCYGIDERGKALSEAVARDPYFYQCVYKIEARTLISMGFLTPLVAGAINADAYDTGALKIQSNGQFSAATVKAAFEGWGRKTATIIGDVVAQTQDATGVMIFAATVKHAEEAMASLHPDNARLITGKTPKGERDDILRDFKAGRFLYLVNVSVLTTGFDAPNVSHIVILRATESVSLLQQIMGRGMRLFEGKRECIVLDYAGNLERHCPDGDLYKPEVKAAYKGEPGEPVEAECELCRKINLFSGRPNDDGLLIDENGYFADLTGQRVLVENNKGEAVPMPAHYGRRCQHSNPRTDERCDYYWSCKMCIVCDHANDIAARYCSNCKAELINPSDKLIDMHRQHVKDPTRPQCEEVISIEYLQCLSRNGNDMVTATVTTPRRKFQVYLLESTTWLASKKLAFANATDNFTTVPRTIRYCKEEEFWKVLAFNLPTDDELLKEKLSA